MSDMLDDLGDWLTPLISRIEPAQRGKLARSVAQQLRRSQQQRIVAQRNPDGTPFAPRKQRKLRGKVGRIKRKAKMFTKLRTVRYVKASGSASAATVGFAGRISRIARVHQYGLRDRPAPGAKDVHYAKRELLGLSAAEREMVRDQVLQHLAGT
ncbi:phage virion morphogenesis protein [Pseudomonas sp. SA3-5]|uniref:Phage virion morphogenesis protein n=1 Tax=Pseudomonas aestuarii TaxID=3018340 RepID=A0ABT4XE71_9PSED|nr:phage virion morphogenesis protein [Pseudomonas aestuarii]MDA7086503.1 phage virion morphogenesis protein [Pseudomonas aestuarii]